MSKTPKAINFYRLRYEDIPHKVRYARYPRVWFLEQQQRMLPFLWEELNSLYKRFKKQPGKKEILMGGVLLFAFIDRHPAYAYEPPAPAEQTYIYKIPKLEPVKPLKAKLPAKRHEKAVPAPKPVIQAPVASVGVTNCGSDPYMAQIYMHESGCRTNAINPIGACGLGQALPCSKMGCSLSDWACQDTWFKNYAVSVYGSTANAWAAWQSKHWW